MKTNVQAGRRVRWQHEASNLFVTCASLSRRVGAAVREASGYCDGYR